MKTCTRCKAQKDEGLFTRSNPNLCLECQRISSRKYRQSKKGIEYNRAYSKMRKPVNGVTHRDKYFFDGNREIAIQRDGEKCVECGMTRQQHRDIYKRDITVDHIDGSGRYTAILMRNNKLDNLQTLCLPCHGKKDAKRIGQFSDGVSKLSKEEQTK